ncbi:hypothetical protein U1Q18_032309 [Sarracenia purpurea var. burkii]
MGVPKITLYPRSASNGSPNQKQNSRDQILARDIIVAAAEHVPLPVPVKGGMEPRVKLDGVRGNGDGRSEGGTEAERY